jgi:hypothetical protein
MNRVSTLAGKVIDRNQGMAEQSYAWALQIDQELEAVWKQLDPNWLEYSDLLTDMDLNASELRERIMAQMMYHQIRVYLHLPFMLKSQSNSRFTYSRSACLASSREVLRHYQSLRTGPVQPLYECKAVDFIGFTAAVLIMLGIFNYGAPDSIVSPKDKESDIRLIEISIDIFHRASSEKGGKVAMQSSNVLKKMLLKYRVENGELDQTMDCSGPGMMEFVIPYFGTISIRRGGKEIGPDEMLGKSGDKMSALKRAAKKHAQCPFTGPSSSQTQKVVSSDTSSMKSSKSAPIRNFFSGSTASLTSPQPSTGPTSNTSPSQGPGAGAGVGFQDPFVSYEGFYNWGNAMDAPTTTSTGTTTGTQINDDSLSNFPLPTNNFSWQNMPMDIDQDWSWFLNDGGMNAGGTGVGNQPQQQQPPQVNDFSQQGFMGFG